MAKSTKPDSGKPQRRGKLGAALNENDALRTELAHCQRMLAGSVTTTTVPDGDIKQPGTGGAYCACLAGQNQREGMRDLVNSIINVHCERGRLVLSRQGAACQEIDSAVDGLFAALDRGNSRRGWWHNAFFLPTIKRMLDLKKQIMSAREVGHTVTVDSLKLWAGLG